jgi:hypothetical protein
MASIGQSVVGEAPCISLVEVAAEQMLEAIYIVPVVPVAHPFLNKLSNSEY